MICPKCKDEKSIVVGSRNTKSNYIIRRRECLNCGNRFSTVEISEINQDIFTAIHRIMTMNKVNRYQFKKAIYTEYLKRFDRKRYYHDRNSKAK